MVDVCDHVHSCSPLHHPHLYGPADHSCDHQQKGTQAQGLKYYKTRATAINIFVLFINIMSSLSISVLAEGLWVSPGSVHGGRDAGRLLSDGTAVVCGRDRAVHQSREQFETRVSVFGTRGAAEVSRHSRAACDGSCYLSPHGLLCLHDLSAEGLQLSSNQLSLLKQRFKP